MSKRRVKKTNHALVEGIGLDVEHPSTGEFGADLNEGLDIEADEGTEPGPGSSNYEEANDNEPQSDSDTGGAAQEGEEAASDAAGEEQADAAEGSQADHDQAADAQAEASDSADDGYDYGEELNRAAAGGRQRIAASPFVSAKWKNIRPREWLYAGHYIRGYVSGTSAPSKQGKSTLILVEAVSMVTGFDLLGVGSAKMPRHPLRVWVWNGEDPEEEIVRRLKGICLYYGRAEEEDQEELAHERFDFTFEDLDGRLFLNSGRDMPIKIATLDRNGHSIKIAEPVVDDMIETIIDNEIDVTSIDPFINAHSVPENDPAIDAVVGAFKDVAHRSNSSIEHVQHTRKPRTHGESVTSDDSRGSTAIVAAWRDSRVVNVMSEDEAKQYEIDNRFRFLKVDSDRPNMTVRGENAAWRYLESVSLRNAMDGLRADSVGVAVPWSPPEKGEFEKEADAQKILAAVLELIDQGRRITKQAGGDYTAGDLVGYMHRQKGVKTTKDAIRAVLLAACEGRDATIEYHAGNRGDTGYRRVKKA